MADYFVKTAADGGNDGNSGATWALAKATVQAGMNLCSSAGDVCNIAPGRYYESGIVPPSAGTRGSNKRVVGDFNSTKLDGGSLGSGVAAGYIIIDGSHGTSGAGTSNVLTTSSNWPYWELVGLWITGGATGWSYQPSTGAPTNDTVTHEDCIFENMTDVNYSAVFCSGWTVDPDTYAPIKFSRCLFFGRASLADHAALPFVANALAKTTGHFTNPQCLLDRCYLGGFALVACCQGGDSTHYTYLKLTNCTLVSWTFRLLSDTVYNAIYYISSSTYNKIDAVNCLHYGAMKRNSSGAGEGTTTATNCLEYFGTGGAGTTGLKGVGMLPPISYLMPGSGAINTDTGGSGQTYPDLFGVGAVQGADDDYGAQEYVTGQYPLEPCMDISNLTTVTPGPSTGGGLSRGRVVNAGGI